ncbi:MAG: fimbrillin family protein [Rikenellaceae bacterium]
MKRLILSVAVLALAASCSKNEVTEVSVSQQKVIGFTNLNDRVTKAANQDDEDYMVYAMSSTDATAWFMEEQVSGSGDTLDAITDGSVYFWPATGYTVNFYAYAPYESDNLDVADTALDALTLEYTVASTAAEDFTVATPIIGADAENQGGTSTNQTGGVPLVFSHMLTKATIAVNIEEALTDYYYTFTSATLNVVSDVVTVTLGNTTTAPVGVQTGSAASYTSSLTATEAEYTATPATSTAMLFAPQAAATAEGQYSVTLAGLTIYNASGTIVYPAKDTKYEFAVGQEFKAGTSYAITLTISAADEDLFASSDAITFSSSINQNASWTVTDYEDEAVELEELDTETVATE